MAQLVAAFNPTQFDPTQGSSSLPVGKHKVIVKSSEVKPTADGSNGYLQLNLEIIEGQYQGLEGAYRLNLYHQSKQTSEIAHRQLSAVCHAIGLLSVITDSAQLHNVPFIVEVALQKGEAGNEKGYTEVKKVYDVNGNEPKAGGNNVQNAVSQASQPAPNNNGGAWGGGQQGGFNTASNVPQPQDNQQQNGGFNGQQQGNQNAGGWGNQNAGNQQQTNGGNQPAWGGGNQAQGNGNQPAWGNGGGQQGGGQPSWGQ